VAKRSREGALKRAREKVRQEKKEAKRERKETKPVEETALPEADENALMEEFARLSARYEANELTEDRYNSERQRIFEELGIETH
jgi:hypothetical protein